MSEFWHQAIPVLVMFGTVCLLIPIVGFTMWLAMSGDAHREREAAARVAARAAAAGVSELDTVREEAPAPQQAVAAAAGIA